MRTGWWGQYVAGGAYTSPHRGHRDPEIVSITVTGAARQAWIVGGLL